MLVKSYWKKAAIWAAAVGIFLTAIFALIPVHPVFAQLETLEGTTFAAETGLATESLPIVIARFIRIFIGLLGVITVVLFIYSGYLYLTARGEPGPVDKAKKIMRQTLIGLAIIIGSFTITTFILNYLLQIAGIGSSITSSGTGNYTEPLSGSLGSGIIESHYPIRNALDVPRNTRIYITFKEAVEIDSIISGYATAAAAGADTFDLNSDKVLIYETADVTSTILASDVALAGNAVDVSFVKLVDSDDPDEIAAAGAKTFSFDPVELLGNAATDTNYTVSLMPTILKADGSDAFSGAYGSGYDWSFEVSTEIDMTPPRVTSVVPRADTIQARNIVVEIHFNEAMDPVAGSGIQGGGSSFANIDVFKGSDENINGTFSIVNNYQTVEFLAEEICAQDPCGNDIHCLPADKDIVVQAHAASLSSEIPQAIMIGGLFDGLVDAAGNSLDGDSDGIATGPGSQEEGGDDYEWAFETTDEINDSQPVIVTMSPDISEGDVDVNQDIEFDFNILMQSSSLNSGSVKLIPNHVQELWFSVVSSDHDPSVTVDDDEYSSLVIRHATLWDTVTQTDGSKLIYYYWPLINQEAKSAWQICMHPSYGPADESNPTVPTDCATDAAPYCCSGEPSVTKCTKTDGVTTLE
jgi:hypothetical protein